MSKNLARKLRAIQRALVAAREEYERNSQYRLIGAGWLNIARDYVGLTIQQIQDAEHRQEAKGA